uniref:Protein TIC 214 n=1 Tax=Adiantum capillus-veneris TaxID=13818 RepID=TI214_ADICA|nr:hypothetical protein AdcaCp083 [Adiantum capillus-veneris]Q85FG7.2 RecName: Full=Protein TIC 214; AltName: Full=Translocon at the inner envelope membrane of chloroplasts 214; Short=AtTIC214 [Adiantum capillus-veneris]AAP29449.2 hypothetical protein [Adiantum capillus-veneris]
MNTKILLSLPWPKLMDPYMLLGFYYGLLTTLPVGPSQILCVRSFLLGGNLSGLISISGSVLAQLITASSIYCSPIYLLLLRPHLLTIVAIPYTLLFCLVIKDFPNYQILRPVTSLRDSRVARLFLISFFFQILNPIMLPNSVLTRLIYLYFFRYSTNTVFMVSTFMGWLTGQAAFNFFSRLLLSRVKGDSPILYLVAKRFIYATFSIVSISYAVAYLGRAPVSFWTKKFMNESHDREMNLWEIAEYSDLLWWFFKPWPTSFFDPSRANRSNRFVKNRRFHMNNTFYKGRTSTYFFEKCLTDGKERLSFLALPSLSIFGKEMYQSMAKSRRSFGIRLSYQNWVSKKLAKTKFFEKELTDQIKLLDTGSSFSKTMSRKTRLMGGKRRRIPRTYDPFVNNFRIRIPVSQTFLLEDDLGLSLWEWDKLATERKNRKAKKTVRINAIKDKIFTKDRRWKHGYGNPLPWEPLPSRSKRMFYFIFENRALYDYDLQNILKKIKSSPTLDVTWKEIMDLDYEDHILFLTYLEVGCCHRFGWISPLKAFLRKSSKSLSNVERRIRRLNKIGNLSMDLARYTILYFENNFDIPGGDGDFRYRKLRNVGITFAKGKPRSERLMKRYAKVSDFRRKFLKGSMRSRRRKTLLWKALQEKIRSSFFLRSAERTILFQSLIERLTTSSREEKFSELEKDTDYEFQKQLLDISLSAKRSLIGESKLTRSAIAARSDIGPIHNGRGYMLVFQSRFRKFIKLPVLIVLKNIGRILLRQNSEWNKDWTGWKKEIHINCTFDGEDFSQDELPPRWLREGIQIKIVYPFQLKPWHTDGNEKQHTLQRKHKEIGSKSRELKSKRKLKQKKHKFTYLTVLGYQTDIPFGTIQKKTSFWKPVRRKLIRICKRSLPRQIKQAYQFIHSRFEKVSKLNSTPSKKLNLISNLRQGGKLLSDYSLDEKSWMKTSSTNYVNEKTKPNCNVISNSERFIAIGGEMSPANVTRKQLVTRDQVEREFLMSIVAVDSKNLLDEKIDDPYSKITSKDLETGDTTSGDINLVNSTKFERKQLVDSEEAGLSLYLLVRELIETFVSVLINLPFTINRIFVHYFTEFLALYTKLAGILDNINEGSNLSTRSKSLQFDLPSQTCIYIDMWNIGMRGSLNLDLLVNDKRSSSNCGVKNRQSGIYVETDGVSNLYQPKMYEKQTPVHYNLIATKFLSPEIRNNHVNDLTMCFDTETGKTDEEFFDEKVARSIENWGFLNKSCKLDEINWNEWLYSLSRYNLPLTAWRNIAPRKWKVCLSELSSIETNTITELKDQVSQNKLHSYYSIYTKKSFLRNKISNFSKLRKHRNLLQNLTDSVQNGDVENLSVQRDIMEQRFHCKSCIQKSSRGGRNRISKFVHFLSSNVESKNNLNLQIDLLSWLDPDIAKTKIFLKKKKKAKQLKNPLLRNHYRYRYVLDISGRFQKVLNQLNDLTLDEREDADYIFRWKFKFETELEKFRNLISLTRMLGDDQDLITLCTNIEVNSDLLNLQFNAKTKRDMFHNLSVVSAHRLRLVFDDQDLLYKIINPLLKFKGRLRGIFRRRLYRNVYNGSYISNLSHILTERNCKQSCLYNIDDLLSPRRRREFRFLYCLLSPKIEYSQYISRIKKIDNAEKKQTLYHLPRPIRIQKIKRFLWPSHRLEEAACTGRSCVGVMTGSRFVTLRIRMYPIPLN